MIGATDITVIFGQRGSGKSTMQKTVASVYPRLVVIDRLREHNDGNLVTDNVEIFSQFMLQAIEQDYEKFKVVFQFDVGMDADLQNEIFDRVVKLTYMWGRRTRKNLCLSIEEVHFYAEPASITPWLREAIFTGRHSNMALVCSSQRPASVHKSIVSMASHVLVGQLFEKRDIDYLRSTIGDRADAAVSLGKYRFLHFQTGVKEVKEIPNSF